MAPQTCLGNILSVGAALSHLQPCHIFSHKGSLPPPPLAELVSQGGPRKAGPCSPVGHSWLGATHPQTQHPQRSRSVWKGKLRNNSTSCPGSKG